MGVPSPPIEVLEGLARGVLPSDTDSRGFVARWCAGNVNDAQITAFAGEMRRLDQEFALAQAWASGLIASGQRLELASLGPTGDIHCIGIGRSVLAVSSMLVAAAAGVKVCAVATRGLGFWGGVVDVVGALPGYTLQPSIQEIVALLQGCGIVISDATDQLVPADRQFRALHGQTGRYDLIDVLAASVMARSLAAGSAHVVIEITYGSHGVCRDLSHAQRLTECMHAIADGWERDVHIIMRPYDAPITRMFGQTLEIREIGELIRGGGGARARECVADLAGCLIERSGCCAPGQGRASALHAIAEGDARRAAERWVSSRGVNPTVWTDPHLLPVAPFGLPVLARSAGVVDSVRLDRIGDVVRRLGAGKFYPTQIVDVAVGIELLVEPGGTVGVGEPIAMVHASDRTLGDRAVTDVGDAIEIAAAAADH